MSGFLQTQHNPERERETERERKKEGERHTNAGSAFQICKTEAWRGRQSWDRAWALVLELWPSHVRRVRGRGRCHGGGGGGDCSSQGDWVVAASTHAQTLEEGLRRPLPGYLAQREEDGPGGAPRALKPRESGQVFLPSRWRACNAEGGRQRSRVSAGRRRRTFKLGNDLIREMALCFSVPHFPPL